jgi:DNA repair exonuclease SbcCD ATPase subunit
MEMLIAATNGATIAQQKLNLAQAATGWGALISAVAALAVILWDSYHATDALADELNRIQVEGETKMWNLVNGFEELAKKATAYTSTNKEREEALKDIKRIYGEILPQEDLELENLRKQKDGWEELTEAVKSYELERMRSLQQQAINSEMQKQFDELKQDLMDASGDFLKLNESIQDTEQGIKGTINRIVTDIESEILSGSLDASQAKNQFIERFKKYYQIDGTLIMPNISDYRNSWWELLKAGGETIMVWQKNYGKRVSNAWSTFFQGFSKNWDSFNPFGYFDYTSTLTKLDQFVTISDEMANRYGDATTRLTTADTQAAEQMRQNAQKYIDAFATREDLVNKYVAELQSYQDSGQTPILQNADGTFTKLGQIVNEINNYAGKAIVTIDDINDALKSNITTQEHFQDVAITALGGYLDYLIKVDDYGNNKFMQGWVQTARKKVQELGGTEIQRNIQSMMSEIANYMGQQLDIFDDVKVTGQDTYDTVARSVKGLIGQYEELGKQYDQISKQVMLIDPEGEAQKVTGLTKEQRDNLTVMITALKTLFVSLGGLETTTKTKSKGKDEYAEKLKKRAEALKNFYKEYETAQKSFSDEESLRKVRDAFTNEFNTLGMNISDVIAKGMNKQGLRDNLKDLENIVRSERPKILAEFEKYTGQAQMEIDVDIQTQKLDSFKNQMQAFFDNYELSKTFKDLGLNIDLTYMVGGSPTTLDDVKNKLQELRAKFMQSNLTFDQTNELQKQYKEFLKKIREIENKELQERIKSYSKYITSAYGEAATEQIKAYKDIYNVQKDFAQAQAEVKAKMEATADKQSAEYQELQRQYDMYGEQMKRITANMVDEMNKKINKLAWDKFKTSEIFNQMYQDVSNLSKGALDKLITDLTELRRKMQNASDVDYKGLREVSTYIEKLKEARNAINPLGQLAGAMKEVNKLRKEGITFDKAQQNLLAANDAINSYQAQIDDLETIIGLKEQQSDEEVDTSKLTKNQQALYKTNILPFAHC